MKILFLSIFVNLFFSIQTFGQNILDPSAISKNETKYSYLDSIKKTFVKDQVASCVDSLWLKELTNLDLYDTISVDLKNINIHETVDYELPTDLLKKRLEAMDAKSPFNIEYNSHLENVIKSFLKNRKKSFSRLMAISDYYFPFFEESLASKNIPLEIKYLAIVESALNPKAVSKMGATGLWQFMYHTGKQYNLKIDSYVDERSDPLKSSAAAAEYMSKMHAVFGDWDLVLASYNSGPGNVTKAIRRSGGKQNFWEIKNYLPKETQGYLPAFLATMYIYEYHKEHGIIPEKSLIQHFETDTVMIKKQITFQQISDLLDVSVAQIQLFNPTYKINVIPNYGESKHYLRLPKDKISVFTSNEDKIYDYVQHELDSKGKPFKIQKPIIVNDSLNKNQEIVSSKLIYHKVKKGDNLNQIAQKYNVSIADIKKWNYLRSNNLSYGKNLKLHTEPNSVNANQNEIKPETSKNSLADTTIIHSDKSKNSTPNTIKNHIVEKGDNLSNISKRYNISINDIKKWNNLSGVSIKLGDALVVNKNGDYVNENLTKMTKTENVLYIVHEGDSLESLSKKFGSSVDDLKKWNNMSDNKLIVNKSIIVAQSEVKVSHYEVTTTNYKNGNKDILPKSKDYQVQKGDSLYSISKKFPGVSTSDIKKWNNIRGEEIKPGMKLKIYG